MSLQKTSKLRSVRINSIFIGLAVFVVCSIAYFVQPKFLQDIEGRILDARFLLRGPIETSDTVAIVTVDDASLEKYGRWPWSREFIAQVLERINTQGATTVSLDIVFSEPQINKTLTQLDGLEIISTQDKQKIKNYLQERSADKLLANSIEQSGNIITGHFFYTSPELVENLDKILPEEAELLSATSSVTAVRAKTELFPAVQAYGIESNISEISMASVGSGYFNFPPSADGLIRYAPLVMRYNDEFYPSLAVRALANYLGEVPIIVHAEEYGISSLSLGGYLIPTNELGAININYFGPQQIIPTYSVKDLMQGNIPEDALSDRIVILGVTAIGVYDAHSISFGPSFPGVEIQATVLENLIAGNSLDHSSFGLSLDLITMLIIALVMSILLPRQPTMLRSTVVSTLVIIIYAGFNYYLFTQNFWVVSIYALLTWVLCYSLLSLYYAIAVEKNNAFIRAAFKSYLHPTLVDQLTLDSNNLQFGGEHKYLTMLFSDIRNFTNISEKLTPHQLARFLQCYMDPMTQQVLEHDGTLDKYIGDAIMALYGAPVTTIYHAKDACSTALAMIDNLNNVEQSCPELTHVFPIKIGVGIHTGDAVVGNLGSSFRFTYTALGDNVNLTSRLESLTKQYGVNVLISESTYWQVADDFDCRELDMVRVKGKSEPVCVFELCGVKQTEVENAMVELWTRAITAYKNRNWQEALELYNQFDSKYPKDKACRLYLARCSEYLTNPPGEDWDGVYMFQVK